MINITWISQISKGNSYSFVSKEYLQRMPWINQIDISVDTPIPEFHRQLDQQKPQLVILLHNDNNQKDIVPHLVEWREKKQTATLFSAFSPIDFSDNIVLSDLSQFDFLITMTEHSKQQLQSIYPDKKIYVLYHIVEGPKILNKSHSKKLLCEKYNIPENYYLVGICNANNTRKRHDLAVEAFRRFNKVVQNSWLFIKTTGKDSGPRVFNDWQKMCEKLPHTIIETPVANLYELYNAFDLMINCTDGEGFGLTPFEAALADTFTILPWHSSFRSLLKREICIDCQFIASEYARTTENILDRLEGNDRFLIYNTGKGSGAVTISTFEDTMEKVIELYRDIYITSDLDTMTRFYKWAQNNRQYNIDLIKLQYYVDKCLVGIPDLKAYVARMLLYYNYPDLLQKDLAYLKNIVQTKFSWKNVEEQFNNIVLTCF